MQKTHFRRWKPATFFLQAWSRSGTEITTKVDGLPTTALRVKSESGLYSLQNGLLLDKTVHSYFDDFKLGIHPDVSFSWNCGILFFLNRNWYFTNAGRLQNSHLWWRHGNTRREMPQELCQTWYQPKKPSRCTSSALASKDVRVSKFEGQRRYSGRVGRWPWQRWHRPDPRAARCWTQDGGRVVHASGRTSGLDRRKTMSPTVWIKYIALESYLTITT